MRGGDDGDTDSNDKSFDEFDVVGQLVENFVSLGGSK